jgi:hypothetical protein
MLVSNSAFTSGLSIQPAIFVGIRLHRHHDLSKRHRLGGSENPIFFGVVSGGTLPRPAELPLPGKRHVFCSTRPGPESVPWEGQQWFSQRYRCMITFGYQGVRREDLEWQPWLSWARQCLSIRGSLRLRLPPPVTSVRVFLPFHLISTAFRPECLCRQAGQP